MADPQAQGFIGDLVDKLRSMRYGDEYANQKFSSPEDKALATASGAGGGFNKTLGNAAEDIVNTYAPRDSADKLSGSTMGQSLGGQINEAARKNPGASKTGSTAVTGPLRTAATLALGPASVPAEALAQGVLGGLEGAYGANEAAGESRLGGATTGAALGAALPLAAGAAKGIGQAGARALSDMPPPGAGGAPALAASAGEAGPGAPSRNASVPRASGAPEMKSVGGGPKPAPKAPPPAGTPKTLPKTPARVPTEAGGPAATQGTPTKPAPAASLPPAGEKPAFPRTAEYGDTADLGVMDALRDMPSTPPTKSAAATRVPNGTAGTYLPPTPEAMAIAAQKIPKNRLPTINQPSAPSMPTATSSAAAPAPLPQRGESLQAALRDLEAPGARNNMPTIPTEYDAGVLRSPGGKDRPGSPFAATAPPQHGEQAFRSERPSVPDYRVEMLAQDPAAKRTSMRPPGASEFSRDRSFPPQSPTELEHSEAMKLAREMRENKASKPEYDRFLKMLQEEDDNLLQTDRP